MYDSSDIHGPPDIQEGSLDVQDSEEELAESVYKVNFKLFYSKILFAK